VAERNAILNEVSIMFHHADILQEQVSNSWSRQTKFDVIVSNPPYVREMEKTEMRANVLDNEPHLALFVNDDDPLLFYDKIIKRSEVLLNRPGVLYFEINENYGEEICNLLERKNFDQIELKKDMYGKDRMVKAIVT